MFDPSVPYNALPLLPPDVNLRSPIILEKTIQAARSLSLLNGFFLQLPNPSILINSIILQEAKDSSEIENIATTHDALFKAYSSEMNNLDPQTKEVLNYREALWTAYNQLKERPLLTTNLFIQIVQTLKKNNAAIRNAPGTKLMNPETGKVYYTPPEGESVIRDLLQNLENYIHSDDELDPLIKMAVIHYQFEAIHPFFDGNGRTGRIINILYLVSQNLLSLPLLYLSRYIIQNKANYYQALRKVTSDNAWEPWVLYMLAAIDETSQRTLQQINAIKSLLDESIAFCKENLPGKVYSKELIELLFKQPYCKTAILVENGIASRNIARTYLEELVKINVLSKTKIGREQIYVNTKLYKLLSSF
jgi:Fic family protein